MMGSAHFSKPSVLWGLIVQLLTVAGPISLDRPRVNVKKALLWSLLDRSAGQVMLICGSALC